MKLIHLFPSMLCLLLLMQCKKSNDDSITTALCSDDPMVTLTIDAGNIITMEFPECFSITPLQGIDSTVGEINTDDQTVTIRYDIGLFSGEYVRETTPNQVTVQGEFEEFRYVIDGDQLILTFPGAAANFFTQQTEHQDDLVELFKTLKVN